MTFPAARRLRTGLAACALALASGFVDPIGALAQEGAAAVQDVTLTDVVFPLGATMVKIPKLVASGTRLSRDDLADIFRAGSPDSWPARLARLDASSLTAPVLLAEYAGPHDTRQSTTYRDLVARDVRAGRIAELTAAGATLTIAAPGGNGAGTYGALRGTDLNLTNLARLANESGDGKGPPLRVYGSLTVSDVAFSYERGTTVKMTRFEGREIAARQVPGGWNGAFDALAAAGESPAGRRNALSATADLLGAISPASVELRGLSISDSSSGPPVLTEVERVGFTGTGHDAGLALDNLTVAGGAARTRLGKMRLSGSSLAPVVSAIRRMAEDPDGIVDVTEFRRLATALGTLTLSDLVVDLPAETAPVKHGALDLPREKETPAGAKPVTRAKAVEMRPAEPKPGDPLATTPAKPNRIALREAVLGPGQPVEGGPGSTRLTLTGLEMPASLVAGQPLIGALPAYGYGDLSFDLAADAAWDESARTVALREVTVAGKDIGRISITGLFGGIGPELFSGSIPAQTMLMFSGNARTLDLTVENTGLFERFLSAQAKDLSLKPDELRKEYVTASVLGVPVILGNSPAAKEIGSAMGQFVMNPGKLTLRAKSKEPAGLGFVELGTARSPAAVMDRLDVEAKAN
jgi:hypothetical protein